MYTALTTQRVSHSIRRRRLAATLVACGALALTLALSLAPAQAARARDDGPIVIGASLPMTGSLAPFGPFLTMGYQQALADVNAQGGLRVGGIKRQVALHILDNKSDPNLAGEQARTLVLRDGAAALLGAVSPPLNVPMSDVAERLGRPFVTSLTPIRAWLGGRPTGWHNAWDVFFDELQMTNLQFQTSNLVKTNRQVALFTDTEQDGVVMGGLWEKKAPAFGYKVVYHAKFAVGTTDFSSQIAAAQAANAQVLIAQMIPPDAAALWKQIKASGYRPVTMFCEKCGSNGGWGPLMGALAEGTLAVDWWSPSFGYPQTQRFLSLYARKLGATTANLSIIVSADSIARVLFDAIVRAGSTDPAAINAALAATNRIYPMGKVRFGANHAAIIPAVMDQWQGKNMVLVFPRSRGAAQVEAPPPGLR